MIKPTQPATAGPIWPAVVLGLIAFVIGSILAERLFIHQSSYTTFHRPHHSPFRNYDPIDMELVVSLNGQVVFRQVTYLDGSVKTEGDPDTLTMASVWTYLFGAILGVIGGLFGWFATSQARRCCQQVIESPPPSP